MSDVVGDITEVEGSLAAGRGSVFAWPTKKEEGKAKHVDNGKRLHSPMHASESRGMMNNCDWDGFNTIWGRVDPSVALELTPKPEFGFSGGS